MKLLYFLHYTLIMILLVFAQDIDELILLQAKAENYYHQGNYSNAIIIFDEKFMFYHFLGAIFIIAGIILSNKKTIYNV